MSDSSIHQSSKTTHPSCPGNKQRDHRSCGKTPAYGPTNGGRSVDSIGAFAQLNTAIFLLIPRTILTDPFCHVPPFVPFFSRTPSHAIRQRLLCHNLNAFRLFGSSRNVASIFIANYIVGIFRSFYF